MLNDLLSKYYENQVYTALVLAIIVALFLIPIIILAVKLARMHAGLTTAGTQTEFVPLLDAEIVDDTEEEVLEEQYENQIELFDVKNLIIDYKADDETSDKISTPRRMSLKLRLIGSTDSLKDRYSRVRNFLEEYRIHERITKHRDLFYVYEEKVLANEGNVLNKNVIKKVAMITIRRKQLVLSLNVDSYTLKDFEDLAEANIEINTRRYEGYNLNVSLSSEKKVNQAIELLSRLLEKLNVSKKKHHKPTDYKAEYTQDLSNFELRGFGYLLRDAVTYEESSEYKDSLAVKAIVINKIYEEDLIFNPIPFNISLDELANNFNDGDTINLDVLKEKGLAPMDSNKLIITDGTKLDKKLFVDADGYASNVIKMIFLVGGEAKINHRVSQQTK